MKEQEAGQLEKARQGDMDAFAQLFEAYRPQMHRVAFRLAGADDCDDVVMDCFLKVWRALPSFRGGEKLGSWLCKIVRNCALDHLRRRKRIINFVPFEDDPTYPAEKIADTEDARPDRRAELDDLGRHMETALQTLSPKHRAVLLMFEVDGLDYREIAAAIGVGIGTVMSRLFYARQRLRRLLKAAEVTP